MTDSATERASIVGVNHVALAVGDVDAAVEFYERLFRFDLRGRSDEKAFLDMGDQFLALAEVDGAGDDRDGARHFGLVVDDADPVEARLDELDVDRPDAPGVEFFDPWGNRIQVVEYAEVQFTKADRVLEGMGLQRLEKSGSAIAELDAKGMAPE